MTDFLGAFERKLHTMARDHFQRLLDSQEQFIRGETFHYGAWHKWRNASNEDRPKILAAFVAKHPTVPAPPSA